MRIQKILENLISVNYGKREVKDFPKGYESKKSFSGGSFSSVRNDKDPHLVIKYPYGEGTDGFWKFIEHVVIPNQDSNIFLPKVYNYNILQKRISEEGYSFKPYLKMEKLHTVHDVDHENGIHKKISNESLIELYKRLFITTEKDIKEMSWMTASEIHEKIAESLRHKVKDEDLKATLNMIYNFCEKYKYNVDLHPGNIMYRLTPQGPQLVLVDPVY
jgi:hypothetical protein